MRIGVICAPMPGHLNPMFALASALRDLGHTLIFYQIEDACQAVQNRHFECRCFGKAQYPLGSLRKFIVQSSKRSVTGQILAWHAEQEYMNALLCAEIPAQMRSDRLDGLLVDQLEPVGQALAEYLDLPFVVACVAFPMYREPEIPPIGVEWPMASSRLGCWRNRLRHIFNDTVTNRYFGSLHRIRKSWGLRPLPPPEIFYAQSPLAEVCQIPAAIDYPRMKLSPHVHRVGPFREVVLGVPALSEQTRKDRPSQKRLFASLGTLQIGKVDFFPRLAEAARRLGIQLSIGHAGALSEHQIEALTGRPDCRPYFDHGEILSRVDAVVTHGGLNTVLDAAQYGVPMLVTPIGFEQGAIANRVVACGIGLVLPFRIASLKSLEQALEALFATERYREAAQRIRTQMPRDGADRAAFVVAEALTSLRKVEADPAVRELENRAFAKVESYTK